VTKIEMPKLFDEWKATAKTKEKFGLGSLDWTDYIKPEDCETEQLSAEMIASIRTRGPIELAYRNAFERDAVQIWVQKTLSSDGFTSTSFAETELKLAEKYGGANGRAKKKTGAAQLKLLSCLRISHPDNEDDHEPEQDDFDGERYLLNAMRNAAFDAAAKAADANREMSYLMAVGAEIPSLWASHLEDCVNRSREADARYEEAQRRYIAKGGDPRIAQGSTPEDVTAAWIKIEDARAEHDAAEAAYSQAEDDLDLHRSIVPSQEGDEKAHAARTSSLEEQIAATRRIWEATTKAYEDALCDAHLYNGCWVGERYGCARASAGVVRDRREAAMHAVNAADSEAGEAEEELLKNPSLANKENYQRLHQVAGKAREDFETANVELGYLHPGEPYEPGPLHCNSESEGSASATKVEIVRLPPHREDPMYFAAAPYSVMNSDHYYDVLDVFRCIKVMRSPADRSLLFEMWLNCDPSSGVWWGSATTLADEFREDTPKAVYHSMLTMRNDGFINYDPEHLSENYFPVILHKYPVRRGPLKGHVLNAFPPNDVALAAYDPAERGRKEKSANGSSRLGTLLVTKFEEGKVYLKRMKS
jgi:hypothetical protein